MKRAYVLLSVFFSLIIASVALGQGASGESFAVIQQIGRARPRGIQYEVNFDRFVWVDSSGRLLLVDAANYETQHVLYEGGTYSEYRFSHDGRWLALAIDRRVELWNTQTGELAADIEPDGARGIQGALQFSQDDTLLLFDSIVPAPEDIRRSENDTVILPWLWDLPAARDEGYSTLPNRVDAYPFFGFRTRLTNGFVFGPNDKGISAIPERLQIVDLRDPGFAVLGEVVTRRNEPDPISVWFSLRDEQMYIRPIRSNTLVQINSETGEQFEIPVGSTLYYRNMETLDNLIFSDQARIIGEANSRTGNSFLRLLLGEDYRRRWNYHPLTVMLLDILEPVTLADNQMGLLVYVLDEETGRGAIDFLRPVDVNQMVFHPDNRHFMVRRASGSQPIEVYDLATGILEASYFPALRDPDGSHVLTYDQSGEVIISDFQRFDAATGEVLYEDLSYRPGFDWFVFTQDSQRLVTLNGSEWRLWDIGTGEVIRQETVNLLGEQLSRSPDAHRFLTRRNTADGPVIEIVDVGTEERPSIVIAALPDREIAQIIPSPNLENYIVVYSATPFSQHYPGNEIAIDNIHDGRLWFLAGDDLPYPEGRDYGWLNDETVYIAGEDFGGPSQPTRIYGLDYHPSGLPTCLVDAFPDEWTRWLDLWEQLNARLSPNRLGRLSAQLCGALPGTTEDVEAVFHPSPTPTRLPVTATPSFIAGVPSCLTGYFSDEALDYAQAWREITADLSPEEVAEMEELLCEGLTGSSAPPRDVGETMISNRQVMTIDINTGVRSTGSYIPPREREAPRSLELVLEEFRRTESYTPDNARLSPDGQLLAVTSRSGHITVYHLLTTYETLAANATATAFVPQEDIPNSISVRPTPTQHFDRVGEPRPTLTPTVTPTSPPPATQVIDQARHEELEEFCTTEALYHISAPPPDFSATGRLFVPVRGSNVIWVLNPSTGHLAPDETLPRCGIGLDCEFSFGQDWILVYENQLVVSRPDGSEAYVLFDELEQPVWPENIYWLDPDTVEYRYQGYLPDDFANAVTLIQRFDVDDNAISEPFRPGPAIRINNLDTERLTSQPGSGSLAVVRTSFDSGHGPGYKYYIYDRETDEIDYFARLTGPGAADMTFTWHPLGRTLYYRYPNATDWHIFDAETHEHRLLGHLPGGTWSRDGRYRAEWFWEPAEDRAVQTAPEEMLVMTPTLAPFPSATHLSAADSMNATLAALVTPTPGFPVSAPAVDATPAPPSSTTLEEDEEEHPLARINVWDSETGLIRRYCIPSTEDRAYNTPLHWSPDNRYLAFRIELSSDGDFDTARPRTLILDTATGDVTELTFEVGEIIVWTDDPRERGR